MLEDFRGCKGVTGSASGRCPRDYLAAASRWVVRAIMGIAHFSGIDL